MAGGQTHTTRLPGPPAARTRDLTGVARHLSPADGARAPPAPASTLGIDSARLSLPQALHDGETTDIPRSADLRGPQYDDYIREQLRREEFVGNRNDDGKGSVSDIYIRNLSPKPYMYLDRPGLTTVRKKLDARETMTYQEYMHAYLQLIRDPRANQSHLIYYHLEHLKNIAEDALTRDWYPIRAWSQTVFDAIEKGTYTWADTQTIQMHRVMKAVNYQTSRGPAAHYVGGDRIEGETCRDFNSERGCTLGKFHGVGSTRMVHSCTYCYTQTAKNNQAPKHCFHDVFHCRCRDIDMAAPTSQRYGNTWASGLPKNGR